MTFLIDFISHHRHGTHDASDVYKNVYNNVDIQGIGVRELFIGYRHEICKKLLTVCFNNLLITEVIKNEIDQTVRIPFCNSINPD